MNNPRTAPYLQNPFSDQYQPPTPRTPQLMAQSPMLQYGLGLNLSSPYTSLLTPGMEANYQQWVQQNNMRNPDDPRNNYDMRLFYQMNPGRVVGPMMGHYDDFGKTPGHMAYSGESYYAANSPFRPDPTWTQGGFYNDPARPMYVPYPYQEESP